MTAGLEDLIWHKRQYMNQKLPLNLKGYF